MQKLILAAAIMGLAFAVQAGETKASNDKVSNDKEKTACCSQAKAEQTKASGGCCSMEKTACSAKQTPVRQVLMSPKAAAEYAKK